MNTRVVAWWAPSLILCCASLFACAFMARAEGGDRVWFMHASDPQIGYGEDGRESDESRFERLLAHAKQAGAQFVVVTGDLVQDRSFWQWRSFERARATAQLPVYYIAGNHDVLDRGTLAAYRERLGDDYYVAKGAGVTLIIVDSETARDSRIDPDEHARQWAWLERTLQEQGCARGTLCVVATHRPPFEQTTDEYEGEHNWPLATRARLLALLARHGVKTVLAGHLHRSVSATDPVSGITVYSVGGTARVFDDQGAGYREFTVVNAQLSQRYIKLENFPPRQPDFMGVEGWTPRLFRPSLRHWLLTLSEGLAGALAFLAAGAWQRAGAVLPRFTSTALWRIIALSFVFLGVNEQLDLDELALGLLRRLSHLQGWNPLRHQVGAVVAGAVVLLLSACAIWLLVRAGQAGKLAWPAVLGLSVPSAWFVLSTLSDHGFGMVLSQDNWDALLFGAAVLSLWSCRRAWRAGLAIAPAEQASAR